MTKEECIEILGKFAHHSHSEVIEYPRKVAIEAFEMAIAALKAEPCEDCVSRESVIDALYASGKPTELFDYITEVHGDIASLPPVTPKLETVTEFADRCRECGAKYGKLIKQKTGKWIIDEAETNLYGRGTRIWACHCSECGKDPQEEYIAGTENWWLSKLPNFCPNCGMKMEGEQND